MAQRAVVTGCSTGIGRATAIALYEAGYDTVATMRRPEAGVDLPCRVERLDVDSDESVADLFGRLGPVDVLVNNAGVAVAAPVEDVGMDQVVGAFETNVFGVIRCTKAVVPSMRQRRTGTIVTVTSLAGRATLPVQSIYNATKFAAEGFCQSLALELAPFGVRVAIIEPGVVLTPIFEKPYATPSAPYAQAATRLLEILIGAARYETAAEDVAEVITEAIATDRPRLRWPVGPEAVDLVARLPGVADEDLVALFAETDEAAFWRRFAEVLGEPITPLGRQ